MLPFTLWKNLAITYVNVLKLDEDAKRLVFFRLLESKALEILANILNVEKLDVDKHIAALEPRLTTKLDDREWRIKTFAAEQNCEQSTWL